MRVAVSYRLMIFILTSAPSCGSKTSPEFLESTSLKSKPPFRVCSVILHSPRVTNWGSWTDYFSTCPNGTFVLGMQLKTDPFHGNHNCGWIADNTALNGIMFLCGVSTTSTDLLSTKSLKPLNPKVMSNITNQVQKWGKWGTVSLCAKGYAVGFQLRSRKPLPDGEGYGFKLDDVGTCNIRLYCSDGQVLEGDGRNEWGRWSPTKKCPKDHAICAIKTQIERDQLLLDDTALNNVDVGCCPLDSGHAEGFFDKENPDGNHLNGASNHGTPDEVSLSGTQGPGKKTYDNLIMLKLKVMKLLRGLVLGEPK